MYTEGSIRFNIPYIYVFMNLRKLLVFPCKESLVLIKEFKGICSYRWVCD